METPDTSYWMYLGYTVFSVVFFGYIASYFVRFRNLRRDLEMLKELENS